jgi:signal transduction histidine kinase
MSGVAFESRWRLGGGKAGSRAVYHKLTANINLSRVVGTPQSTEGGFLMSGQIQVVLSAMDRLLDWFIPDELASDRDTRKQVRMFLLSHFFGPFIGNVVPLSLYLLDPTPSYDVFVLAAAISVFWVFPFILRSIGHYDWLVFASVQNLNFCILWSCYFYGGVTSPTLAWILTIPLLASFYVGSDKFLRIGVLVISAVNFAGFCAIYYLIEPVPNDMSLAAVQGLGIVSTAAASLYVSMMAFYYAKILASGVELENEVRGHLLTAAELRRAATEAERAGAAKAEFLAKMSHELRTPLNAVIGYSQLLLEDAVDEGDAETAADLERINNAGQHLLGLVNDVLDLSKIVAGKMEVSAEQVSVGEVVVDAAEGYRAQISKNGNSLTINVGEDVGTITGDAKKIRQIVCHLTENAAKFTENGRIEVHVERRMLEGEEVIFAEVKDTGIGIAEDLIPELFEKFRVSDDTSASKYGGTGLGLALCQQLSQLMGGDIRVASERGAGSCFSFWIPTSPKFEQQAAPPASAADRSGEAGIRLPKAA